MSSVVIDFPDFSSKSNNNNVVRVAALMPCATTSQLVIIKIVCLAIIRIVVGIVFAVIFVPAIVAALCLLVVIAVILATAFAGATLLVAVVFRPAPVGAPRRRL